MMKRHVLIFFCLWVNVLPLFAGTHAFLWENDAVVGRDQHYTNGMYYTWMSDANQSVVDVLPFIDLPQKNMAFSISHAIFTPKDKDTAAKIVDDLPYAGYMSANVLAYKSSENFFHEVGLNIGMVGPSAHADDLHKGFHTLIGHDKAQGWDNQLEDRFLYGASYQFGAKSDSFPLNQWYLDIGANLRGDAGNFYTGVLVGGTIRLSSTALHSFVAATPFIGGNESSLLNETFPKAFQWALAYTLSYNGFDRYYIVDEAQKQGYHVSSIESSLGQRISIDFYYKRLKTSFYLKSARIERGDDTSHDETTGGLQIVWHWD
jgi:hypothetical protein